MNALTSFIAVAALVLIAMVGGGAGLGVVFGIVIPYLAITLFLVGFVLRIMGWAKAPVPFRIPTVSGQQKSLSFLRHDRLESPATKLQVLGRMLLEVLLFRSLFRNTRAELRSGGRLVYGAEKMLWAAALAFHWAFLIILIRHLRFFITPVPGFVNLLESFDGFFRISVPTLMLTDLLILASLAFLLSRRFRNPQVRYISLFSDYFPLFLLLGVALSGVVLRHFDKTSVTGIKELGVGLVTLSPSASMLTGLGAAFFVHLFLVSCLIAYIPFSKLMHMGGVFLSPTRNLANDNRMRRHVNPWPQDVKCHDFDEWMEEFEEEIAEAGYELERD